MRLVQLKKYWLIALVVTLAACQGAPPPRPAAKDTGALAAEALERGDYAQAADLYRTALASDPGNLKLHYGLAVAASYLDRRTEAVTEFTWVLDRAPADSDESKTAHQWLSSVGALPRGRTAPSQDSSTPDESAAAKDKEKTGYATVDGRVVFGETPAAVAPMKRMQLLLYDYPSKENYFRMRTDEAGQFRFTNVPPGVYKLTDKVAGQATWRLRVELKAGQELSLELNPGNSTKVRDDFPEPAGDAPSS
jgi:tetratricopeptide (TPR) repeat protein